MQRILKRLTYANVMSTMAMFLVVGGATAFAASSLGKNSVGTKQLRTNAVTAAKLGKNAVTATKIKAGAVGGGALAPGSVTGEKIAGGAITGDKIAPGAVSGDKIAPGTLPSGALGANSVGNTQTQLVKVFKGGAVPAAESRESAPRVTLGSVGPFAFYGKCFREGTRIREVTYIELTRGVATLGSEDGATFETDTEGYLSSATPEENRELEEDAEASPNSFNATSDDEEFQASASDGTEITGLVGGTGAKQGNPPSGDGPFLTGDSCIVGTVAIFGA
ncbi:MAG TPA: hypothetical protein VJL81_13365 [Solirubrobacterales bacterium]|nr:hypothetical protein [Solirubrobacterales bacterium]